MHAWLSSLPRQEARDDLGHGPRRKSRHLQSGKLEEGHSRQSPACAKALRGSLRESAWGGWLEVPGHGCRLRIPDSEVWTRLEYGGMSAGQGC